MIFLTLIICLLLERLLWNLDPYRSFDWYTNSINNTLKRPYGDWIYSQQAGLLIFIVPPVLVVGWLQSFFHEGWSSIAELAFNIAILLFSLGPKDLGRNVDAILETKNNSPDSSENAIQQLCQEQAPEEEPALSLHLSRCILAEINPRLVAPIFWFILFGPVGAVAYRLTKLLSQLWRADDHIEHQNTEVLHNTALTLGYYLDWIPSRLCVVGYAVAGNFEAVSSAWREFSFHNNNDKPQQAKQLLQTTGTAALASYPAKDEIDSLCTTPPVIDDALALVWRNITFWLGVVGISTLIAIIL